MPAGRYYSLREAVCIALRFCGASVLRDPQRFLSYLSDVVASESMEIYALYAWCNEEFLLPFALAVEKGFADSFYVAVNKGVLYLVRRAVDYSVADEICHDIAMGIPEGLGVSFPLAANLKTATNAGDGGRQ